MKGSEIARLRDRWADEDVADVQRQLLDQSRAVKGPHGLRPRWPDTDDGLVDLRGITTDGYGLRIRYLTLERIDLSFACGEVGSFQSELSDCRFDSVRLAGQSSFNRRLERCSFRDAKLHRLSLGLRVVDCDFTGVTAHRLRSEPDTVFERCAFAGADLRGAEFRHASFVDCTFDEARFSASTVFERCSFPRTGVEFAEARVSRSTGDGTPLPDRWAGRAEAETAFATYLNRYVRAVRSGDEDSMPMESEE
ncbi:pentapeptide repeat-containing protein [Streptomyces somaliensis DSM 40738]|uniref:Pentapeptide repeat-containing protein n=1 Tax=Streptomyces somaliensis (strain ATCC 33201 / DSM 40738 / JCM 12659 / KCTC 9044 / NCTC 11332 / NRRL B-12077 / IP 733) TaxID=1134445 RepID=A0AA44DCD8_STRE0|nr:pentapeptide repeat-containing protein [Streptomyces somaliensis]MCQ0023258.1 pentapeptide repeat-containing protein [Streptomyces somaliensis DSM 40738]NKY13805.1 pentapeptide repeat-containing protein [Streptomyces somaliensis DSM 40738]